MLFLILGLLTMAALIMLSYLLGWRMAHGRTEERLWRVRQEGADAARQLHAVAREAFVAMAEAAERKRSQ